MKIEIGESLCYSYLRHVKQCWLVQTNWKASEHWHKRLTDDELEEVFRSMRQTFDLGGSVFKGTKDCAQFLRQAEIDVVGVGQDGSVHAIEVAFHEAGLNYGGGVGNRVLKKLLRTLLILNAYHPEDTRLHIYFVSPKVHRAAQQPLEDIFARLQEEYPAITWRLFTNETFAEQMLTPTLELGESVADTTELFLRSAKLLKLGGIVDIKSWHRVGQSIPGIHRDAQAPISTNTDELYSAPVEMSRESEIPRLQLLVQPLMKTLLEDFPRLLSENDLTNLTDKNYCQNSLGLELGGFALLRRREDGREFSGHDRYYKKVYAGRYYVCSQWWRDSHFRNARSLQSFVLGLIRQNEGHPGTHALHEHWSSLKTFIENNQ